MKPHKLNPRIWINAVNDSVCKAHIALVMKMLDCSDCPQQRALMQLSAGVTLLSISMGSAYAQSSDGIAGMVVKAADQGDVIKTAGGRLFAAVGFLLAGYGGYNWWRRGKEGERSDIKGSQIAMPLIGGAVLGATGFVLIKAGESLGISGASQGALPN
jgi:hypothetical protein